jgi:threonine dehydratase
MAEYSLAALEAAAERARALVPPTPQHRWPLLGQRAGCEIRVKHENHTPIGAFKIRGGVVALAAMKAAHPHLAGVVAASRGNHGQSVAFAAARLGLAATVVVPRGNAV